MGVVEVGAVSTLSSSSITIGFLPFDGELVGVLMVRFGLRGRMGEDGSGISVEVSGTLRLADCAEAAALSAARARIAGDTQARLLLTKGSKSVVVVGDGFSAAKQALTVINRVTAIYFMIFVYFECKGKNDKWRMTGGGVWDTIPLYIC